MRAVIAGSRQFKDYPRLNRECLNIFQGLANEGYSIDRYKLEIVTGRQGGTEGIARLFSDMHHLNLVTLVAENAEGPRGFEVRNDVFLDYAMGDPELGVLIAFDDGASTITRDIIVKAYMRNMRSYVVKC